MMKNILRIFFFALVLWSAAPASAQYNSQRAVSGLAKLFQATTLTDAQLAQYVQSSVAQMDAQNKVLPATDPYVRRLSGLTAGITDADGIPLNFKVYKTNDINAFACPDGSVRVFTGIMDLLDDDELLGVIGHEIGHVVKRHSKKALKKELLNGALRDAVAATDSRVAMITDSQLSQIGSMLSSAKFSRKQENEADNCGYDFLVKNGRNPYGMVSAFQKMQKLEAAGGASGGYLQKMFSDHPDTADRIKKMQKRCKKDGYLPK